jgi:hypothetical protein
MTQTLIPPLEPALTVAALRDLLANLPDTAVLFIEAGSGGCRVLIDRSDSIEHGDVFLYTRRPIWGDGAGEDD